MACAVLSRPLFYPKFDFRPFMAYYLQYMCSSANHNSAVFLLTKECKMASSLSYYENLS